jgi:HPt (histidine-containing phosphotransfer) domain-containing protein
MAPVDVRPEIARVLSLAETLANLGDDPELLRELLDFFVEVAPQQLDDLEAVIAAGDVAATEMLAHGMKGGAANVGAVRMAATARELELLTKDGSLEGAEALMTDLRAEFAALAAVLPGVDWQRLG